MPVYRDLVPVKGFFTRGPVEVMDVAPGVGAAEGARAWFDFQSRVTGIPHKSDL
jgi:hypothetical protein